MAFSTSADLLTKVGQTFFQPNSINGIATDLANIMDYINSSGGEVTKTGNNVMTGSNTISFAAGTAALPSINFNGDLDTGIYHIGANEIGISANGAKVLDISTTGLAITGALDISTNQTFAKEVDHTVTVTTSTTANTAGGAYSIAAGKSTGTAAGGAITISSGDSTVATTTVAGDSGAVTITVGTPGTATTGTGGNAGAIAITGKAGGAASGVAGIGGNGTTITWTAGAGGASSSATGGAVGTGGAIILVGGNGGAASGASVTGGAATAWTFTTGTGGASTLHNGGAGANFTITCGNGGAVTDATKTSGVGGSFGVVAGSAGGTSTVGANGGQISFTGGGGIGTAGLGGNIVFTPGSTSVTTVCPIVLINSNTIIKPTSAPFFLIGTTASDGAFAKSIVGGYVEIRGATGNVQLPTGAQVSTAIGGIVGAGTKFRCVFNAIGATPMTAGNTATITTNTNAVIDASVGNTLVTVTGTSNVNIAIFQFTYDGTNWIVSRM